MSHDSGQKNIRSIRTFSEDAAKARVQNTSHERAEEKEVLQIQRNIEPSGIAPIPEVATKAQMPVRSKKELPQKEEAPKIAPKARIFVPQKHVDLSDEVASVSKPTKNSILSDTDDVFQTSSRAGNIIRDTKRKRFRLFPAMAEAVASWFTAKKEAYVAFRHPNHPVTKAEARKKILRASVREDSQAPKEDFKDVATRMKTVERAEVTSTLSFKEKGEVAAPTWTHVEQADTPQEIKSEPAAKLVPDTAEEVAVQEIKPPEIPEVLPQPQTAVADPVAPHILQDEIQDQASIQAQEELPAVEEPVQNIPTAMPQAPGDTQAYEETQYQGEQKIPLYYFVIVILVASLLGIGISYYFFVVRDTPAQQITVEYKVPQLLSASAQIPFRFGEDRRTNLTIISDFVSRSQTVTQLYPTVIEDGIEKPAPTQTIINELQLQAPGSFTRAIQELTFGATQSKQPFIILKVSSFDTAFAGILDWEKTMSVDLSPLFGEVVINSFDPSARTDTQVREAFFKDIIASNKNARLLLDEEGKDRIIYTFTNQNTILITTTREALDEILPLVR